jgi:glycosyltransferase involved in cell wall biosynthesis
VSELITDGKDGLLLKDPRDSERLAHMIDILCTDRGLRQIMGANAARTACQYTWERNADQFKSLFEEVLQSKAME